MCCVPLDTARFILGEFEKKLEGYSINGYIINEYEKVLLVEDSLALYCGITGNETFQNKVDFGVHIEELTYNTLGWKYNHTQFVKKMEKITGIQYLGGIEYKKFRGYTRLYWCPEQETLCEQIGKLLPELRLRERYKMWEGVKYYFVVMELENICGDLEYGVAHTTRKPHTYIISKCNALIKGECEFGEIRMLNCLFEKAFYSWKGVRKQKRLEEHFRYFYFEKFFREKDDAWRYADEILERAYNNEFKNEERSTYTRPINKWKSEELVYNMTKKIYRQFKVIYQHRPFFLRNPQGGQMSYDVYISELKVAIEYQGKQHFEPVDFFGGEDSYEKTVERDKIKQELSKRNGVKLVYINYWEEITPQLIRERVEQFL